MAIFGHFWLFLVSVFPVYISEVILTIWGLKNDHFGPFLAIAFMGLSCHLLLVFLSFVICEGWLQHSASISLKQLKKSICSQYDKVLKVKLEHQYYLILLGWLTFCPTISCNIDFLIELSHPQVNEKHTLNMIFIANHNILVEVWDPGST